MSKLTPVASIATFFGFGMPVTLFVDSKGVIRDKKVGPMSAEEIAERSRVISKSSLASGSNQDIIQIGKDGTKFIIEPSKFEGGGVGKDGIRSIDNPKFLSGRIARENSNISDLNGFGVAIENSGYANHK